MLPGLVYLVMLALQLPEPPPPATSWQVPFGCPTLTDLEVAIDRRLGRPLAPGEVTMTGHVTLAAAAPRYHLTLRLAAGGRNETRQLAAERCGALAEATALLVVLAVHETTRAALRAPRDVTDADPLEAPAVAGPERAGAPLEAPGIDVPLPEPRVEPVLTPVAPAADKNGRAAPASVPRLGGLVRVHGGAELGVLPGISGTIGLVAALLWRRARLEVYGNYLAPRTMSRPEGSLRVSAAGGAVHGCARPGRGRLEVPLCGGLEVAAMRGAARGFTGARDVACLWLAGVVSVGTAVRVHPRWSLWAAVQAVARISWPRFELRDPGPALRLFEPAPVSGRLLMGVELRIADPW